MIVTMLVPILLFFTFISWTSWTTAKDVKIVGGIEVTNRSEFAYQALLLYNGSPYCGGTIIEKKYILTAGHCCFIRYQKVLPSQVQVVVGNLNLTDWSIVKNVKDVTVHEDFDEDTLDNDLAIFELAEPFESWTSQVNKLSLNEDHITSGDCIASGWGTTFSGSNQMSSKLLYVSVPIIDWQKCYDFYHNTGININNKSICAGALDKDSCQGDSGGPLVCQNKLAGVVSYGIGCGFKNLPGVYVEVSKYLDWLKPYSSSSITNSAGFFFVLLLLLSLNY